MCRFDEWPTLIRKYSKCRTYEATIALFDEVEQKVRAHSGDLPSQPIPAAQRAESQNVVIREAGAELETLDFSCFDEEC